jgi:hypothetical protein
MKNVIAEYVIEMLEKEEMDNINQDYRDVERRESEQRLLEAMRILGIPVRIQEESDSDLAEPRDPCIGLDGTDYTDLYRVKP